MKMLIALLGVALAGTASAATLIMPQVTAQGHSCGGVYKTVTIVGFDANNNVQATLLAKTTCSSGGRYSRPVTYTQTYQLTWDTAGAYTFGFPAALVTPRSIDPYGNNITIFANGSTVTAVTLNAVALQPLIPVAAFVPQEIGNTLVQAETDLTALGLNYSETETSAACSQPAGAVCNQLPAAGTVAQFGDTISLWYIPPPVDN